MFVAFLLKITNFAAEKLKIVEAKMLFSIILTTFVLYILWHYYYFIRAFFLARKIDGPPAYPLIGSGLLFYNKNSAGILFHLNDRPNSKIL